MSEINYLDDVRTQELIDEIKRRIKSGGGGGSYIGTDDDWQKLTPEQKATYSVAFINESDSGSGAQSLSVSDNFEIYTSEKNPIEEATGGDIWAVKPIDDTIEKVYRYIDSNWQEVDFIATYSVQTPPSKQYEGLYWLVSVEGTIRIISQYTNGTWVNITANITNVFDKTKRPPKFGDWWIQINSTDKIITVYEYLSSGFEKAGDINALGVGETLPAEQGYVTERFNDYTNNKVVGTTDYNRAFYSHLEGRANTIDVTSNKVVQPAQIHLEGNNNTFGGSGANVHMEGQSNTVQQGQGATNTWATHIEGSNNIVTNTGACFVGGRSNTATGMNYGLLTGENNTVTGSNRNIVGGEYNELTNSTSCSLIVGAHNSSNNANYNIIGGTSNTVKASNNIVGGSGHTITGTYNNVAGYGNTVSGNNNVVAGNQHNVAASYSVVCGFNIDTTRTNNSYIFYAGGGSTTVGITSSGYVYALAYNSSGADYAEYFEWVDGNPEAQDRRGLLISIVGDQIELANGDEIDGIVSANPSVCGNNYQLNWQGKYKTDIFGTVLCDGENNPILSEDYDDDIDYIPRSQRKEWSPIGLVGRLIIVDDGTCEVGKYVSASNGIGCAATTKTNVKVLKRIDANHIEVLIK